MKLPQYFPTHEFDAPECDRQASALQAIARFVYENVGDPAIIRRVGDSYRWTAPDGREAAVGWVR